MLVVGICLLFSSVSFSKEPTATQKTKLQRFLSKKGILYVKEFYPVGTFVCKYDDKVKLEDMVVYQPGTNIKLKGLVVRIEESSENESSALLDYDETKGLLKAIKYVKDLSQKWAGQKRQYTEVVYSTKDNFKCGFYQSGDKQVGFLSVGYIDNKNCYFSIDKLSNLERLVSKALEILKKQ